MFRKTLPFVAALLIALLSYQQYSGEDERDAPTDATPGAERGEPRDAVGPSSDQQIARAFEQRLTAYQVRGRGVVRRVLSDDNDGSRHQRFILDLNSGQSLMIAHNIDLAPRIRLLQPGDQVEFYGEYEWNQQGGVIHWTHHDPNGYHVGGWLEHEGRRYQ